MCCEAGRLTLVYLFQSNNDEELSEAELQDEDSEDALSRLPVEDVGDPEVLAKLKQQVCTYHHHHHHQLGIGFVSGYMWLIIFQKYV